MGVTILVGNIKLLPHLPLAMTLPEVLQHFQEGHDAYLRGRGPGQGRIRCAGWLQAQREVSAEIEEIREDRRSQF